MINLVDENYFKNGCVMVMPYSADKNHLLLSADEIMFFKNGEDVIINKFYNDPNRKLFSNGDIDKEGFGSGRNIAYSQILKCNNYYLNLRNYRLGNHYNSYYFTDNNLCFENNIDVNKSLEGKGSLILNEKEFKEYFNYEKYDSFYVIDKDGNINFAYNKLDNLVIGDNNFPFNLKIDDFIDYVTYMKKFNYYLITSKYNNFNMKGFNLYYNGSYKIVFGNINLRKKEDLDYNCLISSSSYLLPEIKGKVLNKKYF